MAMEYQRVTDISSSLQVKVKLDVFITGNLIHSSALVIIILIKNTLGWIRYSDECQGLLRRQLEILGRQHLSRTCSCCLASQSFPKFQEMVGHPFHISFLKSVQLLVFGFCTLTPRGMHLFFSKKHS